MRLSVAESNFLRLAGTDIDPRGMFDCPICYGEFPLAEVWVLPCPGGPHIACLSCSRAQVTTRVKERNVQDIPCTAEGCKETFSAPDIENLLAGTPFLRQWQDWLAEDAIAADPHAIHCLRPGCDNIMIREPGAPGMVRCPECDYCFWCVCSVPFCFEHRVRASESCVSGAHPARSQCPRSADCKVEWHADCTCAEYQQWRTENEQADDLFEAWRERNTKNCPKCAAPIQKNGGCNHMTCSRCRHQFCWLCMADYTSSHFSTTSCQQFT